LVLVEDDGSHAAILTHGFDSCVSLRMQIIKEDHRPASRPGGRLQARIPRLQVG